MKKNIPWDIIIKEFKHEISPEELQVLDNWKQEGDNQALYVELAQLWGALLKERISMPSRADKCWKKMEERLFSAKKREIVFSLARFRWAMIAASFVLVTLLSFVGYISSKWYQSNSIAQTYSSFGGKSKVILPDGSVVWLHKQTTLEYTSSIWSNQRKVRLNGEAFFEVSKDKHRPFIVEAHGIKVKVFGTVFNIDARDMEREMNVSLLSGSVAVSSGNESQQLKPGENASCDKSTGHINVTKSDVRFAALWAQESIRFEKKSIKELSKYLSKWYGVKIILDPSIPEEQAYTFTIKGEPFEEILRLMARINPIKYSFDEEDVVMITPK